MAGIDYKNSPIEVREKVAFTPTGIERAYQTLKKQDWVREVIILSTCNRSEIYLRTPHPIIAIDHLLHFYNEFFAVDKAILKNHLAFRIGKEVVNHLFEVACGFQSMILGEDQILGQVKRAYEAAVAYQCGGKRLNRLFLDAITTAKKVKHVTGVSNVPLSISTIALKLFQKQLGSLQQKKALLIGLGEMSEVTIKNLLSTEIDTIYVANRNQKKLEPFLMISDKIKGVDFTERYHYLKEVDIVISCTAAPHFVLHHEPFQEHYQNKKLCILDLAVPRDVDPMIEKLENIQLFRLDDLEKISSENIIKRKRAVCIGKKIIAEDITKFYKWLAKSIEHEKVYVKREKADEKILSIDA